MPSSRIALCLVAVLLGCDSDAAKETSAASDDDATNPSSGNSGTDTAPPAELVDEDGDGVEASEDCDDTDPASTTVATDGDCDGTLTDDDCDDDDPASTTVATDGDCDGTLTDDDCDDDDPTSTTVATDGDCDGTLTGDDCDDADPLSTTTATDGDCDGVPTDDDCDDANASAYPGAIEVMDDEVDNNCNGIVDGALDESTTDCCATPSTNRLYGPASEYTISLGDIDGDGTDDFAMFSEGDRSWYATDRLYRTEVFSGADFPTTGPMTLDPVTIDSDGDDWRYRWPSTSMGDLDGDGVDEMFLNGSDGGMIVRGTTWPDYLSGDDLPSSGPGRYGGNGYNVLFDRIETVDGPTVLLAATYSLADSRYNCIKTRPGSELTETNWGPGSSGTWNNYDPWVSFSWSDTLPTHVLAADFDADGLTDVLSHHPQYNELQVYSGASRPTSSFYDYGDSDTVIDGEEDQRRWGSRRSTFSQQGFVTADFNGDGYEDLASVDWEFGEELEGRAYITSGDSIASSATLLIADAETIIEADGVGMHAILQVSLGGDSDHDGNPDLWVVGVDHTLDPETQHARFYSGATLLPAGALSLSDADATWRPPASEYTGTAEEVWVSEPGDLDGDGFDDALIGATGQLWLLTVAGS